MQADAPAGPVLSPLDAVPGHWRVIALKQLCTKIGSGATARAIFTSWFVDFESVRSGSCDWKPYGEVPDGWEVVRLGQIVGINERSMGRDYGYETIEYMDISSVSTGHRNGITTYRRERAPSRAKRLVADGDVIWSTVRPNRKSYLYVDCPPPNLVVSTGFAVLSPRTVSSSYLYLWVTTDEFTDYLSNNADGSAYPAVRADRFEDAPILLPPSDVLDAFEDATRPMLRKIVQNERESGGLATARDTLLPKLLSGEIRVREAETLVEAAV